MKGEIERLEVEYNENISKEQAKYNLETNKLKDQLFENEVVQKTLEKEVRFFLSFHTLFPLLRRVYNYIWYKCEKNILHII